jgi:integrase
VALAWERPPEPPQTRRSPGPKAATSNHTLGRDELRDLRKLRKDVQGLYVLETERGGPLSVDALQYICRVAGKLAGLGDAIHPHPLRHAAGWR